MNRLLYTAMLAGFVAFSPLADAIGAEENSYTLGNLVIEGPWSRETASSARNGAGFLSIENQGSEDDRLVAASSNAAGHVELHTHLMDGGVMRMRQVEAIEVPAGETVTLQPGGLHLMLMDLPEPLVEGQEIRIELVFEKSGTTEISMPVANIAADTGGHGKGHGMNKSKQ